MLNDVCTGSAALWAWAVSGEEWGHTGWLSVLRFVLTVLSLSIFQNSAACVCVRGFVGPGFCDSKEGEIARVVL